MDLVVPFSLSQSVVCPKSRSLIGFVRLGRAKKSRFFVFVHFFSRSVTHNVLILAGLIRGSIES